MDNVVIFLAFILAFCESFLPRYAQAQVIRWGSCESQGVTVKSDFNISQYLGRWYEQQRYFALPEAGLICVTAEYTPHHDGGINVNNTGVKNGVAISLVGTGYAPDPNVPAKFKVKFPGAGPAGAMWIIETDYEEFSVVYSCSNLGPFRLVDAWLLSRSREQFSHSAMEAIERVLRERDIEKGPFQPVKQDGCTNNGARLAAHYKDTTLINKF